MVSKAAKMGSYVDFGKELYKESGKLVFMKRQIGTFEWGWLVGLIRQTLG